MCNPFVFFVDHMVIKYLVNKAELSGRLVRWVLLLEEFEYTVEYKSSRIFLQADHLFRLSEKMRNSPIDDMFVDDNIFVATAKPEWYAGIVEFLTTQKLPKICTNEDRRKVRVNSRHFAVVGHRLLRKRTDRLLEASHDSACGGHFFGQLTSQKILRARYFWSTLFKDLHAYVKCCDACQRYARNDFWMDMSLHISLPLVPFEKCRIDYVGEVHPHSSKGMAYIIVATKYLTKWVEAKAVKPTRRHLCMKTSS